MEEIKIELKTRVVKKANGETFIAYKGLTNKGWQDLKFTKEVLETLRPTERCFIYVLPENLSVDTRGRFPVVWVRKIEKTELIDFKSNIEDYFG